jgi:hypothetical protein
MHLLRSVNKHIGSAPSVAGSAKFGPPAGAAGGGGRGGGGGGGGAAPAHPCDSDIQTAMPSFIPPNPFVQSSFRTILQKPDAGVFKCQSALV